MTEHPRTIRLCQGDLAAGHPPASDNGENGSGQNLENQGPSGLVGLCRAFEFKKCFEDTRRAQIRNPASPATIRRAATIHSHRFPSIPSFFGTKKSPSRIRLRSASARSRSGGTGRQTMPYLSQTEFNPFKPILTAFNRFKPILTCF
jgi:hypothetical protein